MRISSRRLSAIICLAAFGCIAGLLLGASEGTVERSWPVSDAGEISWPNAIGETVEETSWPSSTGATDYTLLDSCKGAWFLFSDDIEAGALIDRCAGAGQGGANNAVPVGTSTFTGVTTPAGTAAGQDAVSMSGTAQYFTVADSGTTFDGTSYSQGCWINQDSTATKVITRKGVSSTITMGLNTNATAIRAQNRASADEEATATGVVVNTIWALITERVNIAGPSTIEVHKNAVGVCSGACAATTARGDDTGALGLFADRAGLAPFNGDGMECFYFDPPLTDPQLCEITLCGLKGTADGTARESLISNACTCASIGNVCC